MLGIALGVAALIIVLSVMNGFQKEVRDRMLSVVSHIEIYGLGGAALLDPTQTLLQARAHPQVVGAAPFIAAQALLARGEDMKGVLVRGIDPALEPEVTDLATPVQQTALQQLQPGGFGVVLGAELARSMGVRMGEHNLARWLDSFIFFNMMNGELDRLHQKYLGIPLAPLPSL